MSGAGRTMTKDVRFGAREERMETMDAMRLATRRLIVATAGDGSTWAGTECWLIREPVGSGVPSPESLDKLVAREFEHPLERMRVGTAEIFAKPNGVMARGYRRRDEVVVWLDDAILRAIEQAFEDDDNDDGELHAPVFELRQAAGPLSQVGFFELDELVAIAMPLRHG